MIGLILTCMNPSKQVKAHVLEYGSLSNISVAMLKLFPFSAGVMLQIVYLAQFISLVGVFILGKVPIECSKISVAMLNFFPLSAGVMLPIYLALIISLVDLFHTRKNTHHMICSLEAFNTMARKDRSANGYCIF